MSFETIKNGLKKFLEHTPELFAMVLSFVLVLSYILVDQKFHPEKYKTPKPDAYTVKVVDEKGNTTLLYKDKTVQIESGVIYVCPLQKDPFRLCSENKEAIRLTGNFMVEKQP